MTEPQPAPWPTRLPLIAILRGVRPEEVLAQADGLLEAGFDCIEVPTNSPHWERSVETLVRHVGDRALVKVTAYDFSSYGGLDGRVVQVSADSIYDEVERQAFFTVIVETTRSYLVASGRRLPITPGMMTDTQIITGRKSVLTYLLKPVLKARSDALHER